MSSRGDISPNTLASTDASAHPPFPLSHRESLEPGLNQSGPSKVQTVEAEIQSDSTLSSLEAVTESENNDEEDLEDYKVGGYHPCKIGETFKNGRYIIVRKLGWGYFSTVWLAKDREMGDSYVALKVVRASQNYTETAVDEIKLLKRLRQADQSHPGRNYVVALLDQFIHVGPNGAHVCMVFELLGENLLSLIKRYHYKGVPPTLVKQITLQVLLALDYTHRKCGMIHTDLKPENVLIRIYDVNRVIEEIEALGWEGAENKQEQRETFFQEQQHQQDIDSMKSSQDNRETITPSGHHIPKSPTTPKRKKKGRHSIVQGSQPLASPLTRPCSKQGSVSSRSSISGRPESVVGDSSIRSPPLNFNNGASTVDTGNTTQTTTSAMSQAFSTASVSTASSFSSLNADIGQEPTSQGSPKSPKAMSLQQSSQDNDFSTQGITALGEELVTVKIADFGSACSVDHHFTDDIQTRQYRAPEILLGSDWGASADCWSLGCMIFELLTGDYLFEPQSSNTYSKDEDHVAQIMELLGPLPECLMRGKYVNELFDSRGRLRNIRNLKVWPLYDVFVNKYEYSPEDARNLCDLLLPLLDLDPEKRADCGSLVHCKWLHGTVGFENFTIDRDPSESPSEAVQCWAKEILQTDEEAQEDLAVSQNELNSMWVNGDTPATPTPDPEQVVDQAIENGECPG